MSDERAKYLSDVIDAMLAAHAEWIESDQETLSPDDEFWRRCDETVEMFSEGSIPGDIRPVAEVVDREFSRGWNRFLQEREMSVNPTHVLPGNGLWSSIHTIRALRTSAKVVKTRRPEPVAELLALKPPCTHEQIAKIWGWVDKNGEADLDKVREEIAQPGIHTSKWVDPRQVKLESEAKRQQAIIDELNKRTADKVRSLTATAPESFADLIKSGVCARQIAQMKRCTVETVYAEADKAGLPRPLYEYADPRTERSPLDPPKPDDHHLTRPTGETSDMVAAKRRPGRPKKNKPPVDQPSTDSDEWSDEPTTTTAVAEPQSLSTREQTASAMFADGRQIDEIAAAIGLNEDETAELLDRLTSEAVDADDEG